MEVLTLEDINRADLKRRIRRAVDLLQNESSRENLCSFRKLDVIDCIDTDKAKYIVDPYAALDYLLSIIIESMVHFDLVRLLGINFTPEKLEEVYKKNKLREKEHFNLQNEKISHIEIQKKIHKLYKLPKMVCDGEKEYIDSIKDCPVCNGSGNRG